MKKENIRLLEKIADSLVNLNVRFHFLDERWKKGGDVDICVAENSLDDFDRIMKKNDFIFEKGRHPMYRFYYRFLNEELVNIHVHIGKYQGLPTGLLEPKEVSMPRGYFLSTEEQIFYFVYRMALGEPFHKYKDYLTELVREKFDKDKLCNLLARVFKNPQEILSQILKTEFSRLDPRFKFSHNLSRAKMYLLNKSVKFLQHVHKALSPAPYIAIVGPDGSGKTTTLNDVIRMLREHNISSARITGGRFRFQLLPLNWMFEKAEKRYFEREEGVSRHARRYHSSLLQIIVPFIFYVEYLLRHLLIIRPLEKRNRVVLSDRSFVDVMVSPNTNTMIAKMLYGILPKPDATIYLFNTADVLAKRKPEHPRHDLETQLKAYGSLTDYFTCKIKTTEKERVAKKVFSTILSRIQPLRNIEGFFVEL